jgi:hypothetical protein
MPLLSSTAKLPGLSYGLGTDKSEAEAEVSGVQC